MVFIGGPVPDFKTADRAHQGHFPGQLGIVPEIGADQDPSLAVQGNALDAGDQKTLKRAHILAKDGLVRQLGLDLDPLGLGKGKDIAVEIGEEENAVWRFLQNFPVAGRNADPALVIQEMKVATGEHLTPSLPTLSHFFPPAAKIRPFLGTCQAKKKEKRL